MAFLLWKITYLGSPGTQSAQLSKHSHSWGFLSDAIELTYFLKHN